MPLILLVIGALFLVLGYQGTQTEFFQLLKTDFTGQNNFWVWVLAIIAVGSMGYIPKMTGLSRAFLFLIFLVFILKNGPSFMAQLNGTVSSTGATQQSPLAGALPQLPAPSPQTSGVQ
jgi:hypothetical protein